MASTRQQGQVEVEENEVTRPSDLGFPSAQSHREIEVESIDPKTIEVDDQGMVEIRMAQTIEEFTYGNPHRHWKLEAGKRYRIPRDVAAYLWDLGYISTTSR